MGPWPSHLTIFAHYCYYSLWSPRCRWCTDAVADAVHCAAATATAAAASSIPCCSICVHANDYFGTTLGRHASLTTIGLQSIGIRRDSAVDSPRSSLLECFAALRRWPSERVLCAHPRCPNALAYCLDYCSWHWMRPLWLRSTHPRGFWSWCTERFRVAPIPCDDWILCRIVRISIHRFVRPPHQCHLRIWFRFWRVGVAMKSNCCYRKRSATAIFAWFLPHRCNNHQRPSPALLAHWKRLRSPLRSCPPDLSAAVIPFCCCAHHCPMPSALQTYVLYCTDYIVRCVDRALLGRKDSGNFAMRKWPLDPIRYTLASSP